MQIANKLLDAYAGWRRFAEAEGSALRLQDWNAVAKCQDAKALLQPLITELSEAAAKEAEAAGPAASEMARRIQRAIEELIALEASNRQLLDSQLRALSSRQAELSLSQHTLDRVHRSYGQSAAANWQTYS